MKMKANYGFKRWPSVKSKDDLVQSQKMTQCQVKTKVYQAEPKDLDYPQKFFLRVVAHLGNPNLSFFLASPNLGDEISFKGGSP
jgi:hypothetical protein